MRSLLSPALGICLLLTLLQGSAAAQTQYVTDSLILTVRSNTTNNYEVLARLTSNTPVTVLGEQGNFYRIRTPNGVEGYTMKSYITEETPKTLIIDELRSDLESLRERYEQQRQQLAVFDEMGVDGDHLAELTDQLETARLELQQMTERYNSLREESTDVLQLSEEKQYLAEQNELLTKELTVLREENRSFHRSNTIQWFFAGAGVFFGGWLIGKISRKKQRGFSRF